MTLVQKVSNLYHPSERRITEVTIACTKRRRDNHTAQTGALMRYPVMTTRTESWLVQNTLNRQFTTYLNISSPRHLASPPLPHEHTKPSTSQHSHKYPKDASVQVQKPFLGGKYCKYEQRIRKEDTRNELVRNSVIYQISRRRK
jgi:hypothetical protein